MTRRPLVIGIGNDDRGDDGAGREVARRLAARGGAGLDAVESSGEATSLMDAWRGRENVVLVDACVGAGRPGSLHRIAPDELREVASLRHASTHSFGAAAAIGLARALGELPARLVVYGIEAGSVDEGARLSPAVERTVARLVSRLAREADPNEPPVLKHQIHSRRHGALRDSSVRGGSRRNPQYAEPQGVGAVASAPRSSGVDSLSTPGWSAEFRNIRPSRAESGS